MSPRRRRLLLALVVTAVLAAAALVAAWRARVPEPLVGPDTDATALAELLRAQGYHVRVEPADREAGPGGGQASRPVQAGVYACREEPGEWDEVTSLSRGGPAERWRGRVVAWRGGPSGRSAVPGYLTAGPWTFFGDPDELDLVAAALRLPR